MKGCGLPHRVQTRIWLTLSSQGQTSYTLNIQGEKNLRDAHHRWVHKLGMSTRTISRSMSAVLRVTPRVCFPPSHQRHRTGEVSKYSGVDIMSPHGHPKTSLGLLPPRSSPLSSALSSVPFLFSSAVSAKYWCAHRRLVITRVEPLSSSRNRSCCSRSHDRRTCKLQECF